MTVAGGAATAVVFDIDGTLIDSVDFHARAWQEALAHFGISVSFDEVRSQIGKGGDQLLPVFVPPDTLDALKDRIEGFRGELFKREYPCPDVFEVVVDRLRVSPSRAIVVGDSPYDAIAAGRAGLRTVGVLCGGFPEEDLKHAGCAVIFRDPANILDRFAEFSIFRLSASQFRVSIF
jgi:beta-phosphoglucomutase-like phosphatase (HAD superfamily)